MLNFNDAPSVSASTHGTNGSVAEVPDGSLDVAGSTFRDTNVGHHIKSRAQETIVRDSILDDGQGDASYSIDLPNGGRAILEENALTQTDSSGINTTMVAYGAKGNLHSQNSLLIKNNLFIDNHANGKGIDNHTNTAAILQGNTSQDVETEVVGPHEFIDAGAANPADDDGTAKDTANDDLANDSRANDDGFPNDGAVNGGLANYGGAKTVDDQIDAPDKGFLPGAFSFILLKMVIVSLESTLPIYPSTIMTAVRGPDRTEV